MKCRCGAAGRTPNSTKSSAVTSDWRFRIASTAAKLPNRPPAAAGREFGNVMLIKETVRDMWGWTPIQQFWQDLGYARRALWKAPAFTIAAVLTLSLGIGANTAMFSIVRAVVLRPLPFAAPRRLVAVNETDLRSAAPRPAVGVVAGLLRLAARHETLEPPWPVTTGQLHRDRPRTVAARARRGGLGEPVFHARRRAGGRRSFSTKKNAPDRDVVVISDEFRRDYLGVANPVGSALTVNGRSFTIVGVTPPALQLPSGIFAARDVGDHGRGRASRNAGRYPDDRAARRAFHPGRRALRPASASRTCKRSSSSFTAALARPIPRTIATAVPWSRCNTTRLSATRRAPLLLLLAAVSCVLLIACVNLANLMTARGVTRQPELALRVALGASRSRVVRLLLAESAALAIVSAIGGILIAWWSLDVLVGLAPRDVRGLREVSIDTVVLTYTAVIAGACALLVGLAPALRATRGDLRADLGAERTSGGSRVAAPVVERIDRHRNRNWRGAAGRRHARDYRPRSPHARGSGFDAATVSTMRVNLPDSRYTYAKQVAFYDRVLPEIARLPASPARRLSGRCR